MFFSLEHEFKKALRDTLMRAAWYELLLHIMCGYQCDKAVNKNDTREVI